MWVVLHSITRWHLDPFAPLPFATSQYVAASRQCFDSGVLRYEISDRLIALYLCGAGKDILRNNFNLIKFQMADPRSPLSYYAYYL